MRTLIEPDSCGQSLRSVFKSRLIAAKQSSPRLLCQRDGRIALPAARRLPLEAAPMEDEIEAFIRFLAVERGLSENYQLSTQRSLGEFADWCAQRKQIVRAREVGLPVISEYLAERKRGGLSAVVDQADRGRAEDFLSFRRRARLGDARSGRGAYPCRGSSVFCRRRLMNCKSNNCSKAWMQRRRSACATARSWSCSTPVGCAFPSWRERSWKIWISTKGSCG